jgi:hypothetical protein
LQRANSYRRQAATNETVRVRGREGPTFLVSPA